MRVGGMAARALGGALVVAGGLGKTVDLLLGDVDVWAIAEVFADEALQLVDAIDDAC